MTSRLSEQKGFEYMLQAMARIAESGSTQWAVIGEGDDEYARQLRELERRFPNNIRYRGFTSDLERQLTRYGDFFANGAWFEPSGLNQFFALRNGTIPVVSSVGGLKDSVKPDQTGFLFPIVPGANGENYDKSATADGIVAKFREAEGYLPSQSRSPQ